MTATMIRRSLRAVGDELACHLDETDRYVVVLRLDDDTQTYREAVSAPDIERARSVLAEVDEPMLPEFLVDCAAPLDACVFEAYEDGAVSERAAPFSERTLPFIDGEPAA